MQPPDLKMAYKDAPAKLVNIGFFLNVSKLSPSSCLHIYMLPSSLYIVIVSSFLIFQIEWQGDAGGISINGVNYNLVHSHWHFPSEHTIDGKR